MASIVMACIVMTYIPKMTEPADDTALRELI